jgi:hypothetical protein
MLLNKGELDGVRVLEAATVERITTNGLPAAIAKTRGTMGWGLANVNVQMDPASPLRGEYGWDGTAGTIFWIDPAREMITVLMTQSSPANPDGIRQRFKTTIQQAVADRFRMRNRVLAGALLAAASLDANRVLETARRAGAVVYAMSVGRQRRPRFLRDLTDATAGALLEIEDVRDLRTLFARVLAEFRQRYVVSFTPRGVPDQGWHRFRSA